MGSLFFFRFVSLAALPGVQAMSLLAVALVPVQAYARVIGPHPYSVSAK